MIIIAALLMLPGILGVLVPMLPGIPFMLVVALIYGVADRFVHLSGGEFAILAVIAAASILVDYFSGIIGARFGGASKRATLYGMIGLIVGLIFVPPFGSMLGLVAGVIIAELSLHKDEKRAIKAATGSLIGAITGIVINTVLALVFLGLFIYFGLS